MTKFGLNRDQPVSVVQEEWRPMAKPWTVRVPVVERESLSNPVSISNVDATDLAPESTGFMQSLQDKILREEKPLLMEEAQESPRAGSAVLPRDKPTAKDPASSKPVAYAFRYQPSYPYIARKLGWEGAVRLRVLVRDDGLVDRLEVVSSSGYDVLDSSALEAVRTWRFEPAREGSHPVRAWIVVPVHFRLEEPSHTG
jgi:TonB family protein